MTRLFHRALRRDTYAKSRFNHLESNVCTGFRDLATLTRVSFPRYLRTIDHSYMRVVRGPGTDQVNILDLGPVHQNVGSHTKQIVEGLDFLLESDTSCLDGAMDGKP